jgi:hypothetical protein
MNGITGLLVIAFLISVCTTHDFDRFRFIDSAVSDNTMRNYLFRGNEPVHNGVMDFDWLVKGIQYAAKNASLKDFPVKFFVLDFNLLSIEVRTWETEKEYFEQNPSLGKFVHWATIGTLFNPMWFPESIRRVCSLNDRISSADLLLNIFLFALFCSVSFTWLDLSISYQGYG